MSQNPLVQENPSETVTLPALLTPTVVVFPGLMSPLLVDRPAGIAAVESAAYQNLSWRSSGRESPRITGRQPISVLRVSQEIQREVGEKAGKQQREYLLDSRRWRRTDC